MEASPIPPDATPRRVTKQFRHPETSFTGDFIWAEVDLSHHEPIAALEGFERLPDGRACLRYGRFQFLVSAPVPGVLRLQGVVDGEEFVWPELPRIGVQLDPATAQPLHLHETPDAVQISSGGQILEFQRGPFGVRLLDATGRELWKWTGVSLRRTGQGMSVVAAFALAPDDHFFGLGGKTAPLDRRGSVADLYSVKVETKRGDYGGFAMPYFLNPRGYGFLLNNPFPRVYFDFGYERADEWTLFTPDGPLDLFLLEGPGFREITQKYHALTGLPALPPRWMLGLWVSWYTHDNASQWVEWMQRFREERWPADAMVLDLAWRGGLAGLNSEGGDGNNLGWDAEKFGDGPALLRELDALRLKLVLHVNTRMFTGPTREEGLAKGFLRASNYEQVVSVLETGEARDWNWSLYAPRVAEGVAGWWVDNSERVDGTLANGLPSRNLYGEVWSEFLFQRMAASGVANSLVLSRGGWLGTQTNATPWPGDTGPGVERLREDIWFTNNLALSGVPYTGVDLGGFKADRLDAELMHTDENIIRRVAHGFLLFAIPRIHNSERTQPKFPWRYDEKVQAIYRQYLELRYTLHPYYYSAAVEAAIESIPLIRPLVFDHPLDPRTYNVDDQMLVGPFLLLAPIMETAAHSRYVYLPEGEWIDYWTGEQFTGPRDVVVRAPLYEPEGLPIFVRKGAILPTCPLAQVTRDIEPEISLTIYPADHGAYRLWESPATVSTFSYTCDAESLTLQLENAAAIPRAYTIAVQGRAITGGNPTIRIDPGGSAEVELRFA